MPNKTWIFLLNFEKDNLQLFNASDRIKGQIYTRYILYE